ncbi:hypothetical protein NDU88_008622 [Pleurodeles waltl]|uniref:Uncharacterized protein n=1 Tax=Pleurodeles waltl TaxID=8319 RepID=A0AAV7PPV2_PLEWA|nr:hypothetical protein NDU88_008622 [Pleurodeles waltl]
MAYCASSRAVGIAISAVTPPLLDVKLAYVGLEVYYRTDPGQRHEAVTPPLLDVKLAYVGLEVYYRTDPGQRHEV